MQEEKVFDVVIIGGGPGGVRAALILATKGKSVALIEKHEVGGCCVHTGCIPTKTLVETAHKLHLKSDDFWTQVTESICENVSSDYEGLQLLLRARGVHIYQGEGVVKDRYHVAVGHELLRCTYMIIATGASPVVPKIQGLDCQSERVGTTDDFWSLKKLPKRIAILGAGVTGCEIAGALMNQVDELHLIDIKDRILTCFEDEQAELVEDEFINHGVMLHMGCGIRSVREDADGIYMMTDQDKEIAADYLLITAGRSPVYPEGLEHLLDQCPFDVDKDGCTKVQGVYMIGDANGQMPFAHYSQAQAGAVSRLILGEEAGMQSIMPVCAFTEPPLASVGMTDAELSASGLPVVCGKAPFFAVGMAKILGCPQGYLKLYRDTDRDILVGARIAGCQAQELISALLPFIQGGVSASVMKNLVYAHPTVSEAIMIALLETYDGSPEVPPKRKRRK